MWIYSREGNLINVAQASSVVIRPHKTKDSLFELVVIFPGIAATSSGMPIPDQHAVFEGSAAQVMSAKTSLAERLQAVQIDGISAR